MQCTATDHALLLHLCVMPLKTQYLEKKLEPRIQGSERADSSSEQATILEVAFHHSDKQCTIVGHSTDPRKALEPSVDNNQQ